MVKVIYEDERTVVKMVTGANGELLYTRTYTKDEDGCTEKSVRVYADGSISE